MTVHAQVATRTAAQVLVDQLRLQGVSRIFCVPGESYLPVLDALVDSGIAVTVCRNEGGASMMAEAWGKQTGRPGICFVTRGPGATNASGGIHIAQQDATPMILFVGQVERDHRGREAFQEMDFRAFFGGMTKWVAEVNEPDRMAEMVSRAFATAMAGRNGPVVLSLPHDMLPLASQSPDAPRAEAIETAPGSEQMAALEKLLAQSRRPMMILGGTAIASFLYTGNPEAYAGWLNNPGHHGFSEMLYEFSSAAANNGSGFEGLGDNTPFWNIATGLVMLLSRYLPIIGPVAIAGMLASKKYIPESAGTLKTDTATFGVVVFAVIAIVAALAFFPALTLGPLAEYFSLYQQ